MLPHSLSDLWTIYRLQHQGVPLDLKGIFLRPATPLYRATARRLPDFGVWSGRVLTVVLREQGRTGFVQARWRTAAPALDLLFIAPSLEAAPGAAWLWQRLIQELGRDAAGAGAQRLFAHLPEEEHAAVEVMRQGGFALYGQDYLYRLDRAPLGTPWPGTSPQWRPREPIDDWGLTRLYHGVTPPVVQQAETLNPPNGGYTGWWGDPRHGCYVLPGESEGEALGFLRLTRGERAHWLKLVLHPSQGFRAQSLLSEALGRMRGWPARPIFCDVRDYEGAIIPALERCGFERAMTRLLLVRHTLAAIRGRVHRPLAAVREGATESVPSSFYDCPDPRGTP